jgi:uncharacterized RDD family membrane protein YckC
MPPAGAGAPQRDYAQPDEAPGGPLPYAGLAVRLAGLFYDALLTVPLLFIAGWLFLAFTRDASSPGMHALFRGWLLLVLGVYFVYCWRRGQTLAMKTWRLRLVDSGGALPSTRQAVARYLLAVLGLGLLGAGFLWALVDPQRQFLHDRLVGTRIVRPHRRSSR